MSEVVFNRRLRFVDGVISLSKNEENLGQKIYLLESANHFMTNNHCGVFSYAPMENMLKEIGKSFAVKKEGECKKNSFLHVMTRTFTTGGHTKLVENFLFNRGQYDGECHDVLLLNNNDPDLPLFLQKINKENRLYDLSGLNVLDKILELVEVSQKYENIILHHNMYDVLPIIALSQFSSTKNIFVYNHADHLYWVGSSIVKFSLEMSTDGMNFSQSNRGGGKCYLLPIPLSTKQAIETTLKDSLSIADDEKVILTIGHEHRYHVKENEYSFKDVIKEVLKVDKKVVFIVVGEHSEAFWGDLWQSENVRFVGAINRDEINSYYSIADIYVDSFPMGGGTSTLDAITFDIPSIKVKHIFFEFDSLKSSVVESKEVSKKIIGLLDGNSGVVGLVEPHLTTKWNLTFDEIIKDIKKTSLNSKVMKVEDNYSNNLYEYQSKARKQLLNRSFLKLSLQNKIKYLICLLRFESDFMEIINIVKDKIKK